jgi:hypothetical protein
MAILLAAMAAAFGSSVFSLQGSNADRSSKRALAAAEAGENLAIYRLNKLTTTDLLPCIVESGTQLALAPLSADGWCPTVTGSVDGATFRYRLSPIVNTTDANLQHILTRRVISSGTVGDKTRRIESTAVVQALGSPLFGNATLKSNKDLTFEGNASLRGPDGSKTRALSNGNIVIGNSASVCSDVVAGPGKTISGTPICGGSRSNAPTAFTLTPVDQGTVATTNSNGRFFSASASTGDTKVGNPSWDPAKRELTMTNSETVTLGGSDYSLCKLRMTGTSQLIVAASAKVRIFFDSPEACGYARGAEQISMTGGTTLTTTSQDASALQIFMVGSSEVPSSAELSGTSNIPQFFTLYAPYSDVHLGGTTDLVGAVAADQVALNGDPKLTTGSGVQDIVAKTVNLYKRTRFIECTSVPTGSNPESGC